MGSGVRERVTPATRRPYTAGHFELSIDGHKSTAYLKSVDTGDMEAQEVTEAIGAENKRIKHISVVEVPPISVEFGISGASQILKWIQASIDKQWGRRNGQITHADFDLRTQYEYSFNNALITEVTFPTLDGAAREPAYVKLKFQPESSTAIKKPGPQIVPSMGQKQKTWVPSAFRLRIDGIDEMAYCNKLESFTIKQGVKKLFTGMTRYPEIEPTKIEFPGLSGTIALEYADKLFDWYQEYVKKGTSEQKAQKTGAIEFLDPTRSKVIFAINLMEVGITNVAVVASTANQDQIKRAKFKLYVGEMKLDGPGLGLE